MSKSSPHSPLLRINLRVPVWGLTIRVKLGLPKFAPTMQTVVGAGASLTVLHSIPQFTDREVSTSTLGGGMLAAVMIGLLISYISKRANQPWIPTAAAAFASSGRFIVEKAPLEAALLAGLALISLLGIWIVKFSTFDDEG